MFRSLKNLLVKVQEFARIDQNSKDIFASVGNLAADIDPGDIVFYRYRTVSRNKLIHGFYICLTSSTGFKKSLQGNTLFGGFELDTASPETLVTVLKSLYKNRGRSKDISPEAAKNQLSSILGIKQYKTFNVSFMSYVTKIDLKTLIQNSLLEEAEDDTAIIRTN